MMIILDTSIMQNCDILTTTISQGKEVKGIKIEREEVKLLLFADDLLLYVENPKVSTPKQLELLTEFSKFEGYKILNVYQGGRVGEKDRFGFK